MSGTVGRRAPVPAEGPANLADILERVLDKGIVIAGDIRVDLLDIELLTIRLRLIVVSVDKAKEMGIDWWESDPSLSSRARREESVEGAGTDVGRLAARVAELEKRAGPEGRQEGSG
ncbi:gas vesicle protein [Streptomyces griseocarneus]|uniref:gas vesicle protein n=1 Tax=Streptomyces griseocarneus TaxID=51201 RepID=UPI00167C63B9|nr:gas vesicle protein [Streptomyces griseocarneus]MBZ6475739.1 gas vesicle protein [Streptomyces griseocarneus]GHG51042.1 hypothetical protein GCM10018779_11670 [Streptomyces griseocarneus]